MLDGCVRTSARKDGISGERSVPPPFNVWNTVVRHKNMAIVGLWVSCDGGSAENLDWWIWFTGANFILRWNWNLNIGNVPDVYIIKFRFASYRQYIDVWGLRCPDVIKLRIRLLWSSGEDHVDRYRPVLNVVKISCWHSMQDLSIYSDSLLVAGRHESFSSVGYRG